MNTILTDDEIADTFKNLLGYFMAPTFDDRKFARAIEAAVLAKLREQEPIYQIKAYESQTAWHDANEGAYHVVPPSDRRIVYAAPQPAVVPPGYKLVPVEPTAHQESAGRDAAERRSTMREACKIYKAMIAAAPEAPATAVVQVPQLVAKELERIAQDPPISGNEIAQARVLMAAGSIRDFGLSGGAAAPEAPARAGKQSAVDEFNRVIQHAITLRLEAFQFLNCWNEGDWDGCREFGFEPSLPYEIQAPALPAEVREAIKVAREALAAMLDNRGDYTANRDAARAAIARIDALEGGK